MTSAYYIALVEWLLAGIAGCSVLHQVDLLIREVKAERLEAWKQKPVEALEAVEPFDVSRMSLSDAL